MTSFAFEGQDFALAVSPASIPRLFYKLSDVLLRVKGFLPIGLGVSYALLHLQAAARLSLPGDSAASLRIARLLAAGVGTADGAADWPRAMELAQAAAAAGNATASVAVGDFWRQMPARETDHAAAMQSYRQGVDRGERNAEYALATYLIAGSECNQDLVEGRRLLEAASDKGHLLAAFDLLQLPAANDSDGGSPTLRQRQQRQQQRRKDESLRHEGLLQLSTFFLCACRFGSGAVVKMLDPATLHQTLARLGVFPPKASTSVLSVPDTICSMFYRDGLGHSPVEYLAMAGDLDGLKALIHFIHQEAIPLLCRASNLGAAASLSRNTFGLMEGTETALELALKHRHVDVAEWILSMDPFEFRTAAIQQFYAHKPEYDTLTRMLCKMNQRSLLITCLSEKSGHFLRLLKDALAECRKSSSELRPGSSGGCGDLDVATVLVAISDMYCEIASLPVDSTLRDQVQQAVGPHSERGQAIATVLWGGDVGFSQAVDDAATAVISLQPAAIDLKMRTWLAFEKDGPASNVMLDSVSSLRYVLSLLVLASLYNSDDAADQPAPPPPAPPPSFFARDPSHRLQLAVAIAQITTKMINMAGTKTYGARACSVEGMKSILSKCLESDSSAGSTPQHAAFLAAANRVGTPSDRRPYASAPHRLFASWSHDANGDDDAEDDDGSSTATYAHTLFDAACRMLKRQGQLGLAFGSKRDRANANRRNRRDDSSDSDLSEDEGAVDPTATGGGSGSGVHAFVEGMASLVAAVYDCSSLLIVTAARVSAANSSSSSVPGSTQLQDAPEAGVSLIANIQGHPTPVMVVTPTVGKGLDQYVLVRIMKATSEDDDVQSQILSRILAQSDESGGRYCVGVNQLYFSVDGFNPTFVVDTAKLRRFALASLKSLEIWNTAPSFFRDNAEKWRAVTSSAKERIYDKVSRFLESAPLMEDVGTCSICSERMPGGLVKVATFSGGEHFKTANCSCTFCSGCIQHWIEAKLSDFTACIPCMSPECGYTLYSEDVRRHASHRVYGQFRRLFEQDHRSRLLEIAGVHGGAATASAPAVDTSSFDQMSERSRCCPHCYVLVERSEGCSDMLCTCGKRFKWDDPKCKIDACIKQLLKEDGENKKKAASLAVINGAGAGAGAGAEVDEEGRGFPQVGSNDAAFTFRHNPHLAVAFIEQSFGLSF